MRYNKPIIVFVGDDDRATDFMEASGMYVLGAPTLRIALAQTIFSYPDAIVIDGAADNMLLAEDAFFHLRSIEHPPMVVLSDAPGRWETEGKNPVIILPNATSNEVLTDTLRQVTQRDTTPTL